MSLMPFAAITPIIVDAMPSYAMLDAATLPLYFAAISLCRRRCLPPMLPYIYFDAAMLF